MYLPLNTGVDSQTAHGFASQTSSFLDIATGRGPSGGWSSIIGIVTAIIGNVLISFALNTQRYAHIRLARERDQREEREDSDRKGTSGTTYGTEQLDVAEHRAQKNARASVEQDQDGQPAYHERDGAEASESDALIPSLASRKSSTSGDSTSTVRPGGKSGSGAEKSYLQSPYWWLGISLMVVGEAGNFLAYGFAPASIVSPLGVVALIVNCLIAPWMLHETFRKRDGLGVLVAVAGAVVVVLSASDSNPKLAPEEIWGLITTWEFETYLGVTIFLILVLMAGSNTEFGEKSILVDLGLVALFGGYTALSTKGVASLLSNTLWHAITFPITYLLVAVLIGTAIMQIKYVNRALQRFDSTQVIPTQFVLFTISVILGSAVLYRDFERETREDAIKFVAGCALTFFGVWLITSGRKTDKDSDEESLPEDDTIQLIDETSQQPEIRERADGNARLQAVRSNTPSVVVTSNDTASQSASFSGLSPTRETPWTGGLPTNISSIHIKSAERLPALTSPDGKKQPPRMHATTSAPLIPTAASLSPLLNRPSTPIRQRTTPYPDSPNRFTPRSPRSPTRAPHAANPDDTPGRRSIVDMLPGPLLGPLSSSLSAIVADSLRRGVDVRPNTLNRRRTSRKSVKPQRSFAGDTRPATSPLHEEGCPLRLTTSEAVGGSGSGGRGRSFSASVSDVFKARRARAGTLESESEEP